MATVPGSDGTFSRVVGVHVAVATGRRDTLQFLVPHLSRLFQSRRFCPTISGPTFSGPVFSSAAFYNFAFFGPAFSAPSLCTLSKLTHWFAES